jgi:HSP20 family molecular chaperone IbpA
MNHQLTNRLDGFGFFDPFFAPFFEEEHGDSSFGSLEMKTDIQDLGDGYQMDVELPGFEKKDIALNLNEGYLTISAKVNRDHKENDKKGNYIHRERFSGVTTRSYYVGEIEEKDVKASYNNGVLTINFPKEDAKKIEAKHAINID